jgi:DNA-binding GntR family transcriptional regulator
MSGGDGYRTMADVAYQMLQNRILSGALRPGERIDQDAEAQRLNASRMPVREALRRLEAEGLVVIHRHRGAVVRPLSVNDLEDLYVLRLALEGVAGRLGTEHLTDDGLQAMHALLPAMEAIVARQDPAAWIDLDWTFHEILYRAARRPRLLRTIQTLREEASRYRRIGLALPDVLAVSLREHKAILEACARRDGEEVEFLIRNALERTRRELRQWLEQDSSTALCLTERVSGDAFE